MVAIAVAKPRQVVCLIRITIVSGADLVEVEATRRPRGVLAVCIVLNVD